MDGVMGVIWCPKGVMSTSRSPKQVVVDPHPQQVARMKISSTLLCAHHTQVCTGDIYFAT
jgi:hypothetical protein